MRTPTEYVAAALAKLRQGPLADRAATLTCGDSSATVTLVGSARRGENDLAGDEPAEAVRALALAADFPALAKGDVATLGDAVRIVTGATVDASVATMTVGFSAPLDTAQATVTGLRGSRRVSFPVGVLALDTGAADAFDGADAPTYAHNYTLVIARDDWQDSTPPEVADLISFIERDAEVTVKVSTVTAQRGWFVLKCRTKG